MQRWQVGHVLDELFYYTQSHFKEEEDIMKQYAYPLYKVHRKVHEDFVSKVRGEMVKDWDGEDLPACRCLLRGPSL